MILSAWAELCIPAVVLYNTCFCSFAVGLFSMRHVSDMFHSEHGFASSPVLCDQTLCCWVVVNMLGREELCEQLA